MARIELENVSKVYGGSVRIVAKFDRAAKDEVEAEELAGHGESLWTARVNPETSARPGHNIDLAVDANQLHFFDPQTGQAIARQPAGDGSAPVQRR